MPPSEIDASGQLAWAMLEASPDALVMVDDKGLVQLVNRQTELMFGYDRSELLGRPVEVLLPAHLKALHESHRTKFGQAPAVRSMGSGMQLRAKRRDNSEFPVEISLSPLPTASGMQTLAAVRDITDRVTVEVAAEFARTRRFQSVEAAGEIRSALTSSVASMQDTLDLLCGWARDIALARDVVYCRVDGDGEPLRQVASAGKTGGPDGNDGVSDEPMDPNDGQLDFALRGEAQIDNTSQPGPRMVVPVQEGEQIQGVLVITRDRGGEGFNDDDLVLVSSLASSTASALQLNEARAGQQKAALLEDRERIGRDMHDKVIGRLFATGMALQSTTAQIASGPSQERILAAVGELDDAIREIRTTIYGLRSQLDWGKGARGEILAVAVDHHSVLGFEPRVDLTGPIDQVPRNVLDEALATLREALGNAAKHAKASTVTVDVKATGSRLAMTVRDNGVGFDPETVPTGTHLHGNGLRNMASRAQSLGGTYSLTSSPGEGVCVEWAVSF